MRRTLPRCWPRCAAGAQAGGRAAGGRGLAPRAGQSGAAGGLSPAFSVFPARASLKGWQQPAVAALGTAAAWRTLRAYTYSARPPARAAPQGADLLARDSEGRTPLHHAVMHGHLGVVDALLGAGGAKLLLAKDVLNCTPVGGG